ncbi:FecCD family ABC transporter permease [Mariniluteicoccus flavus]
MTVADVARTRPDAPEAADAPLAAWRRRGRRRALVLVGLALTVVVTFWVSMVVGPLPIGLGDVVAVLTDPATDARTRTVVLDLRLPPALLAVLVGAALSLAGVQMQTILDNPLAEPFTLGVSAAAAFGAALAIVTGVVLPVLGAYTLTMSAAVMALVASGVIAGASLWRGATKETMVLLGIALVFGFQALLALLQYRASTESLQQIVFWSLGSMTRATWPANAILGAALVILVPLFWANGWRLTALRLGDARAASMGVDVGRVRVWTLVGVSLLAAAAVSFVGIIGFIGLVGPHIARALVGEDQRFLMPGSMLAGAARLSAAHAANQVIVPGVVVPVGILTALVGVPVFVGLVLTRPGRGTR